MKSYSFLAMAIFACAPATVGAQTLHMKTIPPMHIYDRPPVKAADNCFVSLTSPLPSAPFDDKMIAQMKKYYLHNLNVNGTGAVVAARGEVPALEGCCPGGYTYHWMRDGALSMKALQTIVNVDGGSAESRFAQEALKAYVGWVKRMQSQSDDHSAHTEPKWDITTGQPYSGGWCRPQTDGPPLRALALMKAASWQNGPSRDELWKLIAFDLDWLAQGVQSIDLLTCDLWEETTSTDFLWNKATMRQALVQGEAFAQQMGDYGRAASYKKAVNQYLQNPFYDHFSNDGFTECPVVLGGSCKEYGKSIDGAVILALIHTSWTTEVNQIHVAKTVEAYNTLFCGMYKINTWDSAASFPGILYGRYEKDAYGGGNPWVLITAALSSLLYQAAQNTQTLTSADLSAWGSALNVADFKGTRDAFVAAGDSVLHRLYRYTKGYEGHLYEQIDRNTGHQYNAEDLTWSYAEVLTALHERSLAMAAGHWPYAKSVLV